MRFLLLCAGLFLLTFHPASAASKLAGTYDGAGTFTVGTSGSFAARMQVAIFNDGTMLARTYNGPNTSALFYGFTKTNGAVSGRYIMDGSTQNVTGTLKVSSTSYIFAFIYKNSLGDVNVKITLKKQQ